MPDLHDNDVTVTCVNIVANSMWTFFNFCSQSSLKSATDCCQTQLFSACLILIPRCVPAYLLGLAAALSVRYLQLATGRPAEAKLNYSIHMGRVSCCRFPHATAADNLYTLSLTYLDCLSYLVLCAWVVFSISLNIQWTSCRRAAATVCPRPSPLRVGAEAPSAAEQTAT